MRSDTTAGNPSLPVESPLPMQANPHLSANARLSPLRRLPREASCHPTPMRPARFRLKLVRPFRALNQFPFKQSMRIYMIGQLAIDPLSISEIPDTHFVRLRSRQILEAVVARFTISSVKSTDLVPRTAFSPASRLCADQNLDGSTAMIEKTDE